MQTQILILIAAIIVVILIIALCIFVGRYSFKNTFLAPRKTEEDAFKLMEERGVYDRDDYKALKFEEVRVVSEDGYMLKGQYLALHPDVKKVVLFIHGYTANHLLGLQFVELYKAMGYNTLMIDMRSHGESGAMYPTYGIKEAHDLKRWTNALRTKLGDDVEIVLHGQSLGAATALMYIGLYDDVKCVIADCPYTTAKEGLQYQFKKIGHVPPKPVYKSVHKKAEKRIGIRLEDASPMESIKNSKIPVLFIHGIADRTIPYTMSERMYGARGNEGDRLFLVEGADPVEAYEVDTSGYAGAGGIFVNYF